MFRSAVLSTKVWHTPIPPTTVGIVDSADTLFTNSLPPLGIKKSMYSSIFKRLSITLRSVSVINCTDCSGKPAVNKQSRIILVRHILEFMDSFPPRNITELFDFRHSAEISTVTFGLLSYITAITPNGTLICDNSIPFCRTLDSYSIPIGLGNLDILKTPSHIFCIRSLSRTSRSIM